MVLIVGNRLALSVAGQKSAATSRMPTARERIDSCAYELFSARGTRAVGVDEIIARSGVAKMTLYRHYPSKNDLILSFLRRREELWTRGWLQAEVVRRGGLPGDRLLAIFDIFAKWFRRTDFEGCSFINVMLEIDDAQHPVRIATVAHLATIRAFLSHLAQEAGVSHPDDFARQWHILMKGSIVAAGEGDRRAAVRAQAIGRLLLQQNRVAVSDAVADAAGAASAGVAASAPRKRKAQPRAR